MLSCDCIESAKFIHGTQLLAKLVYYTEGFISKDDIDRLFESRKKEEEDSSALNITLIHRYGDSKSTWKRTKRGKFLWLRITKTQESTEKQ